MTSRIAPVVLACAIPWALAACFQELDPAVASDPPEEGGVAEAAVSPPAPAPGDAASSAGLTSWQICQSPSCDEPNGTIPFLQQTPPIYLADGGSTTDPCVDVEALSMSIRQTYCANCHGPQTGAGQGGFNYVMDDPSLVGSTTTSTTLPHFVVPGAPYQSYLYVRIANGTMPPASMAGAPVNPVPTASDLSVLYGWILACFPDAGGYVTGGGSYGTEGDAGAAATDLGPPAQ
jgi:hypothetical protein